jgi:hypothetical protein
LKNGCPNFDLFSYFHFNTELGQLLTIITIDVIHKWKNICDPNYLTIHNYLIKHTNIEMSLKCIKKIGQKG